jgi:hypothetical protein
LVSISKEEQQKRLKKQLIPLARQLSDLKSRRIFASIDEIVDIDKNIDYLKKEVEIIKLKITELKDIEPEVITVEESAYVKMCNIIRKLDAKINRYIEKIILLKEEYNLKFLELKEIILDYYIMNDIVFSGVKIPKYKSTLEIWDKFYLFINEENNGELKYLLDRIKILESESKRIVKLIKKKDKLILKLDCTLIDSKQRHGIHGWGGRKEPLMDYSFTIGRRSFGQGRLVQGTRHFRGEGI